ncbi:hypothetical protein AAMO2058_001375300 [Amorphochlora amoebiformis]
MSLALDNKIPSTTSATAPPPYGVGVTANEAKEKKSFEQRESSMPTGLVAAFSLGDDKKKPHLEIGELKIERVDEVKPPANSANFQTVEDDSDDSYLAAFEAIGVPIRRESGWLGMGHRVLPGQIGLISRRGVPEVASIGQHYTYIECRTLWKGIRPLSDKIIQHKNVTICNIGSNQGAFIQDIKHNIIPLGPGRYVFKQPYKLLTSVVSTIDRDGAMALQGSKLIYGASSTAPVNGRAAFVKVPVGYVGLFRDGNTIGEKPPGEYVIYKQGMEFLGNANVQEYGKNLDIIRVYTKDPTPVMVDVYVRVELHQPRILRGKTQYISLIDALEELVALKLKDTIGALTRNELQNPNEIPDYKGSSLAEYLKAVSTAELSEFAKSVGGSLLSIGFRVHYEDSYQNAMNNQAVQTLKVDTRLKNANAVAREEKIIAEGKKDSHLVLEQGRITAEVERVEKMAVAKAKAIRAIAEAEAAAIRTVANAYKGLDQQSIQATVLERLAAQGVQKVKEISDKTTVTFVPEGFSGMNSIDLAALRRISPASQQNIPESKPPSGLFQSPSRPESKSRARAAPRSFAG